MTTQKGGVLGKMETEIMKVMLKVHTGSTGEACAEIAGAIAYGDFATVVVCEVLSAEVVEADYTK
jgi:hypothetical protein